MSDNEPKQDLILVVLETSHIQKYIFGSNRLKENVGASYLVAAATEEWVHDVIFQLDISHNLDEPGFLNNTIESNDLDVEILYCGGGNAVLLFRYDMIAKSFISILSRKALMEAPGLQLTFHKEEFNWHNASLSEAVGDALGVLKTQRSHQPPRTGIAGLGVTTMCASTSLPATMMDKDPDGNWQAISAEVYAKREAGDEVKDFFGKLIPEIEYQLKEEKALDYRFALEFDDLGRTKGESSFIAVVHIDGNDMGEIIRGMKKKYPTSKDNRPYIDAMRKFSENVKNAASDSLIKMLALLMNSIDEEVHKIQSLNSKADIQLEKKDGKYILPFRPLVTGGDDITFVCDGRIGLDMAVSFIKAFEKYTGEYFESKLTACAGVAIVNAHYPFARAYNLAEELCQSAKLERHDTGHKKGDKDRSLIDWHYTTGGLYDDLDGMREREYVGKDGLLYLRPVFIGENEEHPHRTWDNVQRISTQFQTSWSEHRSKAKALMDELREGDDAAKAFQIRYMDDKNLTLPEIKDIQGNQTWHDGRCLYYDALELMDLYIPITEGETDNVS
jgi:hypothetical protein